MMQKSLLIPKNLRTFAATIVNTLTIMRKLSLFFGAICLAAMALFMTACGPENNDPNDPTKPDQPGNQEYVALARLTVTDSVMPFISSAKLVYTLPGEQQQTVDLSFGPIKDNDPEVKIIGDKYPLERCLVASVEKTFKTKGEVKMQFVVEADTLRPVYAEYYDAAIMPILSAGRKGSGDGWGNLNLSGSFGLSAGLPADRFVEFLQRKFAILREETFNVN